MYRFFEGLLMMVVNNQICGDDDDEFIVSLELSLHRLQKPVWDSSDLVQVDGSLLGYNGLPSHMQYSYAS